MGDIDPPLWPEFLELMTSAESYDEVRADFYRTVLEAVDAGVVIADSDGVARGANPAAAQILGVDDADLIGSTVYDERWQSVHEDGSPWPPEHAPTMRALGGHDMVSRDIVGVHRPDGSIVWVSVNARPLRGGHGATPIGVVTTYTDISLYKQAQERLRDADRRVQRVQQLESLGNLASGIAHDFNNVLMVIRGYAEAALGQRSTLDKARSNLERIVRTVDRAAEMVNGLLSFSHLPAGPSEPVLVNDVVLDSAELLTGVVGADIELRLDLGADVGAVLTDPVRFERLLLNLATNARDAMPDGGWLSIATHRLQFAAGEPRPLPELTLDDYVVVVVTDVGTGMTAEVQQRVFEPFFTTRTADRRHGLGLASVYGVVAHSGGQIAIDSRVGEGTTFRIYLPRVEPGERDPDASRTQAASGRADRVVLVVDDESDLLHIVAKTFRDRGYRTGEAPDASAALALLNDLDDPLALLVTDVMMDGIDGYALARRVRAHQPGVPVVFMSGASHSMPMNEFDDAVLLAKPFALADLLEVAERLILARDR